VQRYDKFLKQTNIPYFRNKYIHFNIRTVPSPCLLRIYTDGPDTELVRLGTDLV